jgi:hypothetical protein
MDENETTLLLVYMCARARMRQGDTRGTQVDEVATRQVTDTERRKRCVSTQMLRVTGRVPVLVYSYDKNLAQLMA